MAISFQKYMKKQSPELQVKVTERAELVRLQINLAAYRERLRVTQVQLAEAMSVSQPAISAMEQPGQDIKLSTLKKYIEATGGKPTLDIELPNGEHFTFSL